jgi:hypothetical protein
MVSQIIERPISFYALCERHVLPFHGFAHVGYVSHERIADALNELMAAHGVSAHLEAAHLCTQMRGVREEHSKTVTTVWEGGYTENAELRREFLAEVRDRDPWRYEDAVASTTYLTVRGLATDAACRHIRKHDQDGPTVVGEEPQPPYLRPPRSEVLWTYLDRERRPRGVLPWNCVGHLEAARPTIATGGPERDEVPVE